MITQTEVAGTAVADGPEPAASIAIAGDDVWMSVANGPPVVAHYRSDGTLITRVPLRSSPVELAAVTGHAYAITERGDVVAIDASTNTTTTLATLPASAIGNAVIAASGSDLWADTTELVHIDLESGVVTARRPALVLDLAASPAEPGRVWAAPFEPDPSEFPGSGAGSVVRLTTHGVEPDGVLFFQTTMSNGINRLAVANDGTVYGENEYTSQVVRIVPD